MLILEQSTNQLGARVLPRFLAVGTWQKHLRLDAQQACRHFQVVGGLVEPQRSDASKKLLGDACNRNVVDIHLFIADERQQQVEWTGELTQFHDKRGRRRVGQAEGLRDHAEKGLGSMNGK